MSKEWSNLSKVVYKRTYARDDFGKLENWDDTVNRAIQGNIRNHKVTKEEIDRLRYFLLNRKATPAGRGLWFSGSPAQDRVGGRALVNPLDESTRILTKEYGWVEIGKLEGETVTVLSNTKLYGRDDKTAPNAVWTQGKISHGEIHSCKRITYQDTEGMTYSVVASLNHRWFRQKTTHHTWERITTEELEVGDYLPRTKPPKYFNICVEAIKHGYFFGDGSRAQGRLSQFTEDDRDALRLLFGNSVVEKDTYSYVSDLPLAWGHLPDGEYLNDNKYIYGFLAGYFLADGYMHPRGSTSISSSRLGELQKVKELFEKIGVATGDIYLESTESNYSDNRVLYRMSINKNDLSKEFFIKTKHIELWLEKKRSHGAGKLKILSIEDVGERRVLCATVPKYEQFVIEGFCLTSNCWATTAEEWENFVLAQDLLMLGGGVGFSVEHRYTSKLPKVKKSVTVTHELSKDADFIIPDSREGWTEMTKRVLKSYFVTGRSFTYSTVCIRGAGEPIKGFGGKASGPSVFVEFVTKLNLILQAREGKHIRPIDAADMLCAIGEMVVSGNVRRSAILILGDPWDKEYLKSKRWDLGTLPSYRAMANYSVVCDDTDDLHPLYWKTYEMGEPFGIINRKNIQTFGRMGEKKKDTAYLVNPCQPGYATVLTPSGISTIGQISIGDEIWSGSAWVKVSNKWSTGIQPVFKYRTTSGAFVGTANHKVLQNGERIEASQAKSIDISRALNVASVIVVDPQDVMDGLLIGNGSVHKASNNLIYLTIGANDQDYFASEVANLITNKNSVDSCGRSYTVKTTLIPAELPKVPIRTIPDRFVFGSTRAKVGFLRGLFSANGSVIGNRVALKQTSYDIIERAQLMLSSLGIRAYVTTNKKTSVKFDNGTFICKESYDLNIVCDRGAFFRLIGFIQKYKMAKATEGTGKPKYLTSPVIVTEFLENIEVFDITVDDANHTYWTGGCLVSNCSEATLEDKEACNLTELYLPNLDNEDEFVEGAKLMHRWSKRVSCEDFKNDQINSIITKNRRVGTGITGCLQSPLFNEKILDNVYAEIQKENKAYSKELKIEESIRTTVIKPSGTLSLIGDCTPGIHAAFSRYYIRRVRFASNDALVPTLKTNGHYIEPVQRFDGTLDHGTVVVDFYCETPAGTPCVDGGFDTWKQLDTLLFAQKHWADQAVSVTVYYRKEELPKIKEWLAANLSNLKTISFLCYNDHGFKQAPLESMNKDDYEKKSSKIKPIVDEKIEAGDLANLECASGACPIK